MTRCPCYSRLGAHWVSSPCGLGLLDIRTRARKLVIHFTNMSDTEELFDLAAWETRNGLNRKTTEALSKEDYASLAVLRAMTASDVAALNITGGQARTLKLALGGLGNPAFKPSAPTTQPRETAVTEAAGPAAAVEMERDDSGRAILQAGEMLHALWAGERDGETRALGNVAGYQAPDKDKWGGPASYDPTMLLTMKALTKKHVM